MAWLVNMISPDVRRPIDILTRTKSLQAQQYRAFLRAALPALHDAPLEILRLVAAQVQHQMISFAQPVAVSTV